MADKQKQMPGIVRLPDPFTGPGTYSISICFTWPGKKTSPLLESTTMFFSSIENQAEKQELRRTAHYFN